MQGIVVLNQQRDGYTEVVLRTYTELKLSRAYKSTTSMDPQRAGGVKP